MSILLHSSFGSRSLILLFTFYEEKRSARVCVRVYVRACVCVLMCVAGSVGAGRAG